MNNTAKKPNKTNPESYSPQKPEILSMAEIADNSSDLLEHKNLLSKTDPPKKIINGIVKMPTDCQSVRYPACLASLIVKLENLEANKHKNIHDLYAVVSGLCLMQIDLSNDEHLRTDFPEVITDISREFGDYIKYTMDFAGYTYSEFDKSLSQQEVYDALKKSIDNEKPALICFGSIEWCIINGYDDSSGSIYGYDGSYAYWKNYICQKDEYENDMFRCSNWYEHFNKCIVILDKKEPTVTYDDVLARSYKIIKTMREYGYFEKSSAYMRNNDNFTGYTYDQYYNLAGRISSFICCPIDQRAVACWGFDYMSSLPELKDKAMQLGDISGVLGEIHDWCWVVWRMVGAGDTPIEECAKALENSVFRIAIGDIISTFDRHESIALNSLEYLIQR